MNGIHVVVVMYALTEEGEHERYKSIYMRMIFVEMMRERNYS